MSVNVLLRSQLVGEKSANVSRLCLTVKSTLGSSKLQSEKSRAHVVKSLVAKHVCVPVASASMSEIKTNVLKDMLVQQSSPFLYEGG